MIYWLGHIGIYKLASRRAKKNTALSMEHASVHVYEKQKNEHVAALKSFLK